MKSNISYEEAQASGDLTNYEDNDEDDDDTVLHSTQNVKENTG